MRKATIFLRVHLKNSKTLLTLVTSKTDRFWVQLTTILCIRSKQSLMIKMAKIHLGRRGDKLLAFQTPVDKSFQIKTLNKLLKGDSGSWISSCLFKKTFKTNKKFHQWASRMLIFLRLKAKWIKSSWIEGMWKARSTKAFSPRIRNTVTKT